MNHFIIV